MALKNLYEPVPAVVVKTERHADDILLFRIKREDGEDFPICGNGLYFKPGQFVVVGLWGYGEAPFGIASDPYDGSHVDIIVRKVGELTTALHALKKGSRLTLRGPYGNGYPVKFFRGRDVILIAGGSGIPPIAALVRFIIRNRADYGRVHFVYGARSAPELLLRKDLKRWERDIDVLLTVDGPSCDWKGRCGLVSECLEHIKVDPANTIVAMCGPGPMVDSIEHLVNPMGISDRRIFISMERRMQCGIGRCQHCVSGEKYVCSDGPVFNFDEIEGNWD